MDGEYTCIIDCPRHCSFEGKENRITSCPRFPRLKNSIIFINDIDKTLPLSMRKAYDKVFKSMSDHQYMALYPKDEWEENCVTENIARATSCEIFLGILAEMIKTQDWKKS